MRYLARASRYTLFLESNGLALAGHDSWIVRMTLVHGNRAAKLEALDPLTGRSNYFLGNNPRKWRTRVPNYARVAVRDAYPGIDLILYGKNGELEYDWVVAPGADPQQIRLKLEGAVPSRVESNGDLRLSAQIRQRKPVLYQMVEGRRFEIDGGYVVRGREISFRVPAYDRRRPLVIDPALTYTTFLGGRGQSNIGEAVAVDAAGNAYVTGYTDSPNFPLVHPLKGNFTGAPTTGFVSKISASGKLVYSTFLGGLGQDQIHGIAVDAAGNAYVAGITGSADFPTVNALQSSMAGGYDAFITKISPDGSALLYSTFLGGSSSDYGYTVAADPDGNAYLAGYTLSSDFPTVNAVQGSSAGYGDVFVAKINPSGSALIYATYLGGSLSDYGMDVAADPGGNAYITGYTNSTDFPLVNAVQAKYGGARWNGFVTKLAADGSFVYSTYLGGSGASLTGDRGFAIAADAAGNGYVLGYTSSADFPTAPNGPPGMNVQRTVVTKINPDGSGLVYTAYLAAALVGADSQERNCGIAVDLAGNAYVTGATQSANFPATPDALQSTFGGGMPGYTPDDAFLSKLSADGSTTLYATYLGGNHIDYATGVAVRGNDAYVIGYTWSSDFPTTDPTQARSPFGDVFVTRIAGDGPQPAAILNAASGLPGPIAPGEWITITGTQLGPPNGAAYSVNADGTVDSTLAGVQVLFDTIPGTPVYVSDNLITAIAPFEIDGLAATNVSVIYQPRVSLPVPQLVGAASPGIKTIDGSGRGQAVATNEDGTQNGPAGSAGKPATAGSIISVYGTGGGQTDPPSMTGFLTPLSPPVPLAKSMMATIGQQPAMVMFAGASPGDLPGVLRVDIRTPDGLAGDALPIVITIEGVSSQVGPTVAVQ
ncbi:MAG TPA: SBBP repeat-containing protein [Bryobacteraceae bacterium]|nr:SBBP repeat-containing protein [Bryobacteraceae bacterium]